MGIGIYVILGLVAACLFFIARAFKNANAGKVAEEETKQKQIEEDCVRSGDCYVGLFGRIRPKKK